MFRQETKTKSLPTLRRMDIKSVFKQVYLRAEIQFACNSHMVWFVIIPSSRSRIAASKITQVSIGIGRTTSESTMQAWFLSPTLKDRCGRIFKGRRITGDSPEEVQNEKSLTWLPPTSLTLISRTFSVRTAVAPLGYVYFSRRSPF